MYVYAVKACYERFPESDFIEKLIINYLKENKIKNANDICNYVNSVIKRRYNEESLCNISTLTYKDHTDKEYHVYIRIIRPWSNLLNLDRVVKFWVVITERYAFIKKISKLKYYNNKSYVLGH